MKSKRKPITPQGARNNRVEFNRKVDEARKARIAAEVEERRARYQAQIDQAKAEILASGSMTPEELDREIAKFNAQLQAKIDSGEIRR